MEICVCVALNEIAVTRLDIDVISSNGRTLDRLDDLVVRITLLLEAYAARRTVDLDQSSQIADITLQDDVGCQSWCIGRRGSQIRRVKRIVLALNQNALPGGWNRVPSASNPLSAVKMSNAAPSEEPFRLLMSALLFTSTPLK